MSVLDRAQTLFQSGRQTEAVALVEAEAEAGDPEALYALANWRLFALHGPRDLAAAHRLLREAGEKGHLEALRVRAYLTANGTGVPADAAEARRMLEAIRAHDRPVEAQLELLERMEHAPRPAARERLSDAPRIELVRGLLAPETCRYVMATAEPHLRPSFVVDPRSGARIPHPVRTSFGMNFGPTHEDLAINAVNRRIAEATGTEPGCGEPLHILRYTPGQEYRPHVDALPGIENQRTWTALVYLNEDYSGGETRFPELRVTAKGRQGDALVFANTLGDGRGDPRTRHAGLPVTQGVKWLATRWIRARRYSPWQA